MTWRLAAPVREPGRRFRRTTVTRWLAAASLSLVASAGPLDGGAEAVSLAGAAGLAACMAAYSASVAARHGYRARTRELRSVAHDLRAPLCTVTSYVDLVAQGAFGPVSDEACAALRRVAEVATRAQSVVDSTLRAEVEGAASASAPARVDLARVVSEAVSALDATIRERRGVVVVEGSLPAVRGEATALFRVMENLVQNGLKYATPAETPRVVVRAHAAADRVVIEVQDNGTGFSTRDRERVFEPGVRGDASAMASGDGLGLDTVRRLVIGMAGEVSIPECERGAIVRVTLPAA
ncbi:MAG: HAMP domain-containing sensor histidine kinase [Dehalococcoidia bacterium]|nr:HAMP domain-containing sensor histidine kinase [Dehalococcoidia bacterium]